VADGVRFEGLTGGNFYYYVESFSLGIDNNRIRAKKKLGLMLFLCYSRKMNWSDSRCKKKSEKERIISKKI